MVTTIITTRNGRYTHEHDTYHEAWKHVQAFLAVTPNARWEVFSNLGVSLV